MKETLVGHNQKRKSEPSIYRTFDNLPTLGRVRGMEHLLYGRRVQEESADKPKR